MKPPAAVLNPPFGLLKPPLGLMKPHLGLMKPHLGLMKPRRATAVAQTLAAEIKYEHNVSLITTHALQNSTPRGLNAG